MMVPSAADTVSDIETSAVMLTVCPADGFFGTQTALSTLTIGVAPGHCFHVMETVCVRQVWELHVSARSN